jgi:ATP-binding cassette subfamily B protein
MELWPVKRIFRIMDETEYEPKQEDDKRCSISKGKIEFKNVSFSYDGKE